MLLLMLSADLIWEKSKKPKEKLSQRRDAQMVMDIPKEESAYDRYPLSAQ